MPVPQRDSIAVIGMAGRFPGAANVSEFWNNLRAGVESISRFSAAEIAGAGVPEAVRTHPSFVNASGVLEGVDLFDAQFFGFSARDAEIMDPQQRLFLECAWESLENAGYDPNRYPGHIGVYGGTAISTYLFNIYENADRIGQLNDMQILILNDKDHLTTHVSYKLNLRGPSVAVQTACSTSLVAVVMACDSLWHGQCDMALAGGVAVSIPQRRGYLYQPGGIMSPDGHCRTFDVAAQGTIGGNGVGVVVLKRLQDAVADGDHIYAIVRGAAINNDGSFKIGYTAPSVDGQAAVIAAAQEMAGIDPRTITYMEAHGTATALGDPIEVAALRKAFWRHTESTGHCAIGSVKTNVGHLDPAAGIAGFIKTVLSLHHRQIPPSLHFTEPNAALELGHSPFFVNTTLRDWAPDGMPRRAGVSAFGIGGTNAHVVLEQAPAPSPSGPSRSHQLLMLSAKTASALDACTSQLAARLAADPEIDLADAAYSLQLGRKTFAHRRIAAVRTGSVAEAVDRLTGAAAWSGVEQQAPPPVVFLFPGQGTQYVGMGRSLYDSEPVFRDTVDACAHELEALLGFDIRSVLYPADPADTVAAGALKQTAVTQPALFTVEYGLARLWMDWGVTPAAMLGHSIGEYAAACVAGVVTLPDALRLVAARGRLMQSMPAGTMVAVPLPAAEAMALAGPTVSMAAVNAPDLAVLSGVSTDIERLARALAERGVPCRPLQTSHAFHSAMMDPIVEAFVDEVSAVTLHPPRTPYISNVTGSWITAEEATSPAYYGRQLRDAVQFSQGLTTLLATAGSVFVEVGPGDTLTRLGGRHSGAAGHALLPSLPSPGSDQADLEVMLLALGRLWVDGVEVAADRFWAQQQRRRIPLPTYPFERQRYWIGAPDQPDEATGASLRSRRPLSDWGYVPSWIPTVLASAGPPAGSGSWLLFMDSCGIWDRLADALTAQGHHVTRVAAGAQLALDDAPWTIRADHPADYDALLGRLDERGDTPSQIVHMWNVTHADEEGLAAIEPAQATGFFSLLYLAQALGKRRLARPVHISFVANRLLAVAAEDDVSPGKATALGPCRVLPLEYPDLTCQAIDFDVIAPDAVVDVLFSEAAGGSSEPVIAYRDGVRLAQTFEPLALETSSTAAPVRDGGVYLITGGYGGIGLSIAEHLARTAQVKLVLTGRTPLPERSAWSRYLADQSDGDATGRAIATILEIESLGSEVLPLHGDVSSLEAMAQVIDTIVTRYSGLDGVIHAAGVAGGGIMQLKTADTAGRVMAPKVRGTAVLDAVTGGLPLDFFVICSSLASVAGGFGQADYCAANSFQDAFAHRARRAGRPVTAINWDAWRDVGMAVNTAVPDDLRDSRQASLEMAITPAEGAEVFARVLRLALPQVAVSPQDLPALIDLARAPAAPDVQEELPRASGASLQHQRPNLGRPYVAPSNDTEQSLAGIWQALLGVAPVGINDNFFELGGHSLLALQVISQMRSTLGVEIPIQGLFDSPTIATLAEAVGLARNDVLEDADLVSRLLDEVERLPESEIQRLLDSAGSSPA